MSEKTLKIKYDRKIYDFTVYTDTNIDYEKNNIAGFKYEKDAQEYVVLKNSVKLDADCKESIIFWLENRLRNLEILKKSYSEDKFVEFKNSILSGLAFFKSLE